MEFAISEVCMCAHMCASHCPAPARLQIGGSDVSAQEKPTGNTMLVRVLEVQSFVSYEEMLAPEGVDRVQQFLPGFAGACFVTTFSACQPTHRSVACASPIGRPRLTDPASYPHRSVVCPSPIGQPSSHRSCFVPNPIDLPCLSLIPVTDQLPTSRPSPPMDAGTVAEAAEMYRTKYTADKYKRDGVENGAVALRVELLADAIGE